jgi:hypothetical protein
MDSSPEERDDRMPMTKINVKKYSWITENPTSFFDKR